jgi:creatinine amidohydrolase
LLSIPQRRVSMNVRYGELAWPDIKQAIEEDYIAILPLGCIEQHGPHLPLDTDCGDLREAVELARDKYGVKALLLPALPYGPAWEHMGFPGTMSLTYETWLRVIREVVASLLQHGFRRVLVAQGCGGHFGIEAGLMELWASARREGPDVVIGVRPVGPPPEVMEFSMKAFPGVEDFHAGEFETSIALAMRPHLLHRDRIRKPEMKAQPRHPTWWCRMEEFSETGATGDPTRADAKIGKQLVELMNEEFARHLKDWDEETRGHRQ